MSAKTALLVIDAQQSFLHMPYWSDAEYPAFRGKVTQLIESCVAKSVPVVHIFHVAKEGAFALSSGWVKLLDDIPAQHDALFHKHVHNAFTETGLGAWLDERGIKRLIVSGIRTEQCCETTTRVASDLGYQVDFVTEATLTFPMIHAASGRTYSADDIREKTELVLAKRFAAIRTVAECLAAL
jgi:nicotinamidase-related amidase